MKLFDNRNFGWRFSNPFLMACSLPFFYYFFKAFVSQRIALMAVILLGFSHYLLSFSKIGYNNLQALFATGLVLASLTWALQSMKPIAFSATGLVMGLCFYIYPAALYVVPLPVLNLVFLT
jgi:4-amino-4-deoxy-L-arabinose transferase-like glycosyltransferase